MKEERLDEIAGRFPNLRVALVGDFCLDRYLEIDPALAETSINYMVFISHFEKC